MLGSVPSEIGSKNYGGVAKVVWSLASRYTQKDISFAVGAMSKYYGGDKLVDNIPIYGIKFRLKSLIETVRLIFRNHIYFSDKPLRYKLHLIYSLYYLDSITKQIEFKIIHTHDVINQVPLATHILNLNTPVITTIHGYHDVLMVKDENLQDQMKNDHNQQYQFVNYIVHVSNSVKQQGLELGVTWDCDDTVIYNSANSPLNDFSSLDTSETQKRSICFVGSFTERKGVKRLLDACSILKDKVDHVVFIGDGELRNLILSYKEKYKINIEITGFIPAEDVYRILASSQVFVMPSISESFGLVYIEAILCGTPVIGFHRVIDEFREVLNSDENELNWLIPYNHEDEDANELALKIEKTLDVKERPSYPLERDKIRQKTMERFSWDNIADEYKQVYTQVINRGT